MEQTKITEEEQKALEEAKAKHEDKPKSNLEKVQEVLTKTEEAEKRLDEKIAKFDQVTADALLSGTGGGHIESMKTPEQAEDAKAQTMADEIVGAFE